MKRWICACLLGAALLSLGCQKSETAGSSAELSPSPVARPTGVPEVISILAASPAPTITPLPSPTPTPSPEPTPAPKITDAWYAERNAELYRLIERNGTYATPEEIHAAVKRMDIDPDKPMVALTFDDGPTRKVTTKVLDALEKYNCRATFFVVGNRVPGAEDVLQRAAALGCEIGSHTWAHDDLTERSENSAKETMQKTNEIVYAVAGYTVKSLRPPKGAANSKVKKWAGDLGMACVFWSQSTHDYRLKDPAHVVRNFFYDPDNKRDLQDGDIILLHDLRSYTGDAMEELVKRLVDGGYQLVTVQELLHLSESGFVAGKSYSHQ